MDIFTLYCQFYSTEKQYVRGPKSCTVTEQKYCLKYICLFVFINYKTIETYNLTISNKHRIVVQ